MIVIPAIDIINGQCVRLTGGAYDSISDYGIDPLDQIGVYESAGFSHVHVVDLDGARAKKMVNWSKINKMLTGSEMTIDVSGGIKSNSDLQSILKHDNAKVTIGSFAVKRPDEYEQWLIEYGSERLILGADIKDGNIAIHGWEEQTTLSYADYIATKIEQGQQYIMCTDISKDGMMQGPAIELYKSILSKFPEINLIASGGVRSVDDLKLLRDIGCYGAIVGKAIYEGHVELSDLVEFSNRKAC